MAWIVGDKGGERADLSNMNLRGVNLSGTNLFDAKLIGADLDKACWPLWCGALEPLIDKRLAAQLLYHTLRAMQSCDYDEDVAAVFASPANIKLANKFHRVNECGLIKESEVR